MAEMWDFAWNAGLALLTAFVTVRLSLRTFDQDWYGNAQREWQALVHRR